ncbi:hypothetical protein QI031_20485 [Halotia branconii CENA392]|uniref:Uncharacterized protein n=1 Tax=Halotia branconii CENA392 TaxID=1539056 RepID=A0AAJ6P7Z7_9CYAN|nr:hypothetical protein [Halotia branconii]WGV24165.1 hypothetical protein QI031_20485 [Halotia branconii CENA392]
MSGRKQTVFLFSMIIGEYEAPANAKLTVGTAFEQIGTFARLWINLNKQVARQIEMFGDALARYFHDFFGSGERRKIAHQIGEKSEICLLAFAIANVLKDDDNLMAARVANTRGKNAKPTPGGFVPVFKINRFSRFSDAIVNLKPVCLVLRC